MARQYFGTDGIRGLANTPPMTAEIALKVGMATGKMLARHGGHRLRAVIGKDTRLSGYMIENALMSGFTAVGVDVFQLGPMPTPAVAMLTRSLRADIGVMISASHNPFADNGIKLFDANGFKLSDEAETEIESLIDTPSGELLVPANRIGRATRIESAQERYIEFAKRTLPRNLRLDGMRIVIDCANGAGYKVAPQALWELGAEVIRSVSSRTVSTSTRSAARRRRSRCRTRSANCEPTSASRSTATRIAWSSSTKRQPSSMATSCWRSSPRAGGGAVACSAAELSQRSCRTSASSAISATLGLSMIRTAVGDRHVVEHMRKHGFNVGGEQSGHIVLSDFATTGDGLVAALQVLGDGRDDGAPRSAKSAIASSGCRSCCATSASPTAQPLEDGRVLAAIEAGRARLGATGRLLVRPSGTEPVIRVMAEGEDEHLVAAIVGDIVGVVQDVAQVA